MRKLLFAIASIAIVAAAAPSYAAPCRDAKGKFIKCAAKPAPKTTRCKGPNGKFAKCGTPGAKPV